MNSIKMKFLSLILLCVWGMEIDAYDVTVTEFPLLNQLPTKRIMNIFQDSEGYIWYGTEDGLCCDDGYAIHTYRSDFRSPNLMSSNQVTCITEDKHGRIWFGTERGAYILDKWTQQIIPIESDCVNNVQIKTLDATSDGSIWLSISGTLFRYNTDIKIEKSYPIQWNNEPSHMNSLYEDREHRIWITIWGGGICRLNEDADQFIYYPWPYKEGVMRMIQDKEHAYFWVGTWRGGIIKFNPSCKEEEMFTVPQQWNSGDERDCAILYMVQDDVKGYLWATTVNGLLVYKYENDALISVEQDLMGVKKNQMLDQLIKDRSGNIWVAGCNVPSFIVSFSKGIVTHTVQPVQQSSRHIATFLAVCHDDEPNVFWLFQERHRLYLYNLQTEQLEYNIHSSLQLTNNNLGAVFLMKKSRQRGCWVACHDSERIYLMQQEHMKMFVADYVDLPESSTPKSFYEDEDHVLWIGSEKDLYLYDMKSRTLKIMVKGIGLVTNIEKGEGNSVILSVRKTTNESVIYKFKNGREVWKYDFKYDCTAIATIENSSIWLGTRQGQLFHLDNEGRIEEMTNTCGLNGDAINGLLVDKYNHLWIQTKQKLIELDVNSLSFGSYYANESAVRLFYFFPHSYSQLPSGDLIFGGTGGFCQISPSQEFGKKTGTDIPCITNVKVDGKNYPLQDGKVLEIDADKRNIEINFSSLNHLYAHKVSYAYRLNGEGDTWTKLSPGRNVAYLNQLNKGKYLFEVRCTDAEGAWSKSVVTLQIVRLPAFYETWWANMLYLLILGLSAFFFIHRYRNRLMQKQHKKMEEKLVDLKFRFFTNISHELRTPLTLIITPLDALLRKVTDEKIHKQLVSVNRNAQDLLGLINQLLDFRKLEMGGEKLILAKGDIVEYLSFIYNNFQLMASDKHLDFSFHSDYTSCYMYFDIEKLHKIINNLLSNAFKFTPEGGHISLSIQKQEADGNKYVVIKVADTGIGVSSLQLPHIFERFYQVENSAKEGNAGNGIGLHLVKEYTELHNGKIEVTSVEQQGTNFSVFIPTNLVPNENLQKLQENESEDEIMVLKGEAPLAEKARKKILLVEDNKEFREFLRDEMNERFDIIEAADGEEGELLAMKENPDIIISDIMMPKRNGFELCKAIKSNINMSNIPIILLTARISKSAEMTGYEMGADAYIAKPFSLALLFNRVEHLLALQLQRQKEFQQNIEVNPQKLTITPLDEDLLNRILACIEKNLSNSEYSIADLSKDVMMSRMNLYRKLQAITGQSPTDFVKTIRLKKAAQLLLENRYTIVEVAYTVGFNTPSYFTRVFKEQFGITPTQYLEKSGQNVT